jgi:hypothetical protein
MKCGGQLSHKRRFAVIFMPFLVSLSRSGLLSLAMTSRIDRAIFLIRRNSLTELVDNVRQSLSAKSCCGITLETADAQFLITLSASLPIGFNDFSFY